MPNKADYQRRKDAGLCPRCAGARDSAKVYCAKCRDTFKVIKAKKISRRKRQAHQRYLLHKSEVLARGVTRQEQMKTVVMVAYGGSCKCCGEDGLPFLALDHIHGKGAAERKVRAGQNFYRWLIKNNFPHKDRYQVLCHNCNWAKGTGAVCPHQTGEVIRLRRH